MAVPFIKTSFINGEISPSLFGHVDLAAFQSAAATMRNIYVSYRGGANSRAGTAFVGFSKQTGRTVAPRMVTFQFSINQGLGLEFGNEYMRVISNGAFVTEGPVPITGISQSNPAQVTISAQGGVSASANDGGVLLSYAPGDLVTLAGGTFISPAVLSVTNTELLGIGVAAPGRGYLVNDTISLGGGVPTTPAVARVTTVVAVPAEGAITFATNPSASDTITLDSVVWTFVTGTPTGDQTKIGATLVATLGQLVLDLRASGNASISLASYTASSTALNIVYKVAGTSGNTFTLAASAATPSASTLTGGGNTGIGSVSISTAGVYTTNAAGGVMTQTGTSGSGLGASFQTALFGPLNVAVQSAGTYTVLPTNPVSQASTTGIGQGVTFDVNWGNILPNQVGDWIFLDGISGMMELNGQTVVISGFAGSAALITDVYGVPIDSTAFSPYTGGGTAARIFTLTTPYADVDLPYLKFTQSADVMSVCCWNQITGTSYNAMDLRRLADDNWTLMPPDFAATIAPPADVTGTTSSSGDTQFQYVVTSVSLADGSESIASLPATISNSVDIGSTLGTITVTWDTVAGQSNYNVYKAIPSTGGSVPVGASFGFAGIAFGTQFVDSNITPDYNSVPPLHKNPFATGQLIGVNPASTGSGYTMATATINSIDGNGAVVLPVVVNGGVVAYIVEDNGELYQPGDTITVTGDGSGATGALTVGPQMGTFPSSVAYYQQRRVYASTPNNPDTYFMSQPGSFLNFDSRIPTVDSDSITGTPWSQQVDGIQFMVAMPGGLVVLTGEEAWQLTGTGGSSLNPQPITPSGQQAQPQAYNGCSPTVAPIKIDYQIIYLQAKGAIFREFTYNIYANIYTGNDLTKLSSQLFTGFQILASCYCEEPYKIIWAVRDDGALLSLTYLAAEDVRGWARHDTNGKFVSACSVTEPPVDALYLATQRFPGGKNAFMIERMDNRIWSSAEDCWCVDAGLQLPMENPAATLTASSPTGLGSLTGVIDLVGGTGYSADTTVTVIDDDGKGIGAGAVPVLTIVGGVITAVTFPPGAQGSAYTFPAISFNDPAGTGSGASAVCVLDNTMTFSTDAAVFTGAMIGWIIRIGGGIAAIIGFVNSTEVTAAILSPIVDTIPNATPLTAFPAMAGNWSLTQPVSTLTGLNHLAGATVTGLADGNIVSPRIVSAEGTVTLDAPATAVTLGLGFQAQIQSDYLDAGSPTVQGQRKKIAAATGRLELSRGIKFAANQADGSTLSPPQLATVWNDLQVAPDLGKRPYNGIFEPLYTGDVRVPLPGGFEKPGQVAFQQDNPLPMSILALVPEVLGGDLPEAGYSQETQSGGRGKMSK